MSSLSAEQLEALRHIDSPTLSNAIEEFNVRSPSKATPGGSCAARFPISARRLATRSRAQATRRRRRGQATAA